MDNKGWRRLTPITNEELQRFKLNFSRCANRDKPLLKGHRQLAHMRITYHFIANLYITDTLQILLFTISDKNNIIG